MDEPEKYDTPSAVGALTGRDSRSIIGSTICFAIVALLILGLVADALGWGP